ncbi:MAG: carboxypeptidase regulatory-like domain-containing protein [Candidatus Solibacter usitatus]|nr:carboxypeptidase regulatory-like domain-containing protein [Candidatus Solibacter usitatus]
MKLAAVCLLAPWIALPQVDTGTISGLVRDASGAGVTKARVVITQEATGLSQSENRARRLQFRSEFFNSSNTPQFNNPANTVGSPGVGSIRSAGSPLTFQRTSRQIQFAFKVYF